MSYNVHSWDLLAPRLARTKEGTYLRVTDWASGWPPTAALEAFPPAADVPAVVFAVLLIGGANKKRAGSAW